MFDWEFSHETEEWPELPPEPQAGRRRSWRFWVLLIAGILVLGVAGNLGLHRWLENREQAMRLDLETIIEEEEQARLAGLRDRAADFIVSDVSEDWWFAYRRTYMVSNRPDPVDVTLVDITFEEDGALVTVELDEYRQLRYYRLVGQSWRRAPLPDHLWTGERESISVDTRMYVLFRPRDRAFAAQLAGDLPALLDTLSQWPHGGPELEQIVIRANELHPALISAGTQRIELNSPLLVPYNGILGGTSAVRFALAQTLAFQRMFLADQVNQLPGGTRFLNAANTVTAMHWALSEREQTRLLRQWQTVLDKRWASPFYTPESRRQEALSESSRANVSALLTAEYIYRVGGQEALTGVVRGMTTYDSWDQIFEATIEQSTIELEQAVAAQVSASSPSAATTGLLRAGNQVSATLLSRESDSRLVVQFDGNAASVFVDMSNTARMQTPDGTPVRATCLGAGSMMEITSDWREAGRRLAAEQITVHDPAPPSPTDEIQAAPTDTLVYVTGGAPPMLQALQRGGVLTPLLELDDARQLDVLPSGAGDRLQIPFLRQPEGCNRSWLHRYTPKSGQIESTLLPPSAPTGPDQVHVSTLSIPERLLLIGRMPDRTWRYRLLDPANPFAPQSKVEMNLRVTPLGWSQIADRLVVFDPDVPQRFGLSSLFDDEVRWFEQQSAVRLARLSPSGRWLAYTARPSDTPGAPETLHLLNLTSGDDHTVLGLTPGDAVVAAVWSPDADDERLLVLAGRRALRQIGGRMLLIEPGRPTRSIAESEGRNWFGDPVLCSDGSVVYVAVSADPAVSSPPLMMIPGPNMDPELLTAGPSVRPVACAG